jgi:glucokinase
MKLCGDIGGTKVLLALIDDKGEIAHKCRLASAEFACFEDLLAAYLDDMPDPISGGCLAVAGPVADDGRTARITNLPWYIDCAALEVRFGIGPLALINDFAGVARGVAVMAQEKHIVLQSGAPAARGVKLVLGAGTGLGVAALLGDRVLASEGGHIAFGPNDETQARLWSALQREYGRVTAERVISGPGLELIHRFLSGTHIAAETIGARALAGDAVATHSTDLFFACYGAFAGDLALAFMARGGVVLAGGVTQKLLPLLAGSPFLAAFNAKAEHAGLVACMRVSVADDPDIGLLGAANEAIKPPVC